MKRIVLAGALAISMFVPGDTPFAHTSGPLLQTLAEAGAPAEPLLVLIEYDPWAMVIGSDTPRLVLYDDGVVIYRKDAEHLTAKLSPGEMATFIASLQPDQLGRLPGSYTVSEATDQPTTVILLRTGSTYARVSIYGSLRSTAARAAIPVGILGAYERLAAFERRDAVPWLPEAVEVMIWPYEYAPDESIIWPEGWPGINHADTRQRGDSYSLYVPAAEYPRLRDFLRTRREKGAVLIDGRKWVAQMRTPFPGEANWMGEEEP